MAGKANPFDAFDDPAGGPAVTDTSPAPQSNAFDQFDPGASAPGSAPSASLNSIAQNFEAAGNTDFAHMAGLPKDAIQGVTNAVGAGLDKIVPQSWRDAGNQAVKDYLPSWAQGLSAPTIPIPSSKDIQDLMTRAGIVNSQTTQPQNIPERLAAGAGHGAAAAMALPLAGEAAAATLPADVASPFYTSAIPTATKVLQSATPVAAGDSIVSGLTAGARQAGMGAASGAGGAGAEEAAPDELKPLANMAGQIAGGGAFSLADAAANKAVDALSNIAGGATRIASPFGKASVAIPGGGSIDTTRGRIQAAGQQLRAAASDPDALSRSLAEPGEIVPGSQPTTFQQSNDPGIGQLERGIATKDPAPFLDRAAQNNAARVNQMESLAPANGDPQAVSDLFVNKMKAITAEHDQNVANAASNVNDKLATAGGTRDEGTYAAALRQQIQQAHDASKAQENSLWGALGDAKDVPVDATPLLKSANDIRSSISPMGDQMEGKELEIFNRLTGKNDPNLSFDDMKQLRSSITTAMRDRPTGVDSQAVRRLGQLLDSVDSTIGASVSKYAQEKAGLSDRLGQVSDEVANGQTAARADTGTGTGTVSTSNSGAETPTYGETVPGDGGSGSAPGNQGVQGDSLGAQYKAARAATAQHHATFDDNALEPALEKSRGNYVLSDEQAADKIVRPGSSGGAAVDSYLKANDGEDAMQRLSDMYAFKMRNAPGVIQNGEVNADRLNTWLSQNRAGLSRVPEVAAKFKDVETAQRTLNDALDARKSAVDTFNDSAAAKFTGGQKPIDAVGSTLSNPQAFGDLVQTVKASGNESAMAGLKRAVIEHLKQRAQSFELAGETEKLKPDAFQRYIQTNRQSLGKLFTPGEVNNLQDIATDIQRSGRSVTGSKLPGGSNTAQDTHAAGKTSVTGSVLSHLMFEGGATLAGGLAAGPLGAVAAGASAAGLRALRNAGIKDVNDLLTQAMLHPEVARTLLAKAPKGPTPYMAKRLAQQLTTISTLPAIDRSKNANSTQSK